MRAPEADARAATRWSGLFHWARRWMKGALVEGGEEAHRAAFHHLKSGTHFGKVVIRVAAV